MLRRLAKDRDHFSVASETAEASAGRLRKEIKAAQVSLNSASDESRVMLTQITQIQEEARRLPPEAPSLHQLTSTEAHQFMNLAGVWFLLCIICAAATFGLSSFAVGLAFFRLPVAAVWFAAAGLVGYFAVLGLVFPPGDLLITSNGTRRLIVSGSAWRRPLTILMAVLVAFGLILLLWKVPLAHYQTALWVLVTIFGGSLAAAVSQAASVSKGAPSLVHSLLAQAHCND